MAKRIKSRANVTALMIRNKMKVKQKLIVIDFTLEFHGCLCSPNYKWSVCKVYKLLTHKRSLTLTLTPYSCAHHTTPHHTKSKAYNKQVSFRIWYDRALSWNIFVWHGLCGVLANACFPPVSSRLVSPLVSSLLFPSLFVIAFRYFKYVRLFVWYLRRIYLFTFNPIFFSLSLSSYKH